MPTRKRGAHKQISTTEIVVVVLVWFNLVFDLVSSRELIRFR
jgi:hypothetical protein